MQSTHTILQLIKLAIEKEELLSVSLSKPRIKRNISNYKIQSFLQESKKAYKVEHQENNQAFTTILNPEKCIEFIADQHEYFKQIQVHTSTENIQCLINKSGKESIKRMPKKEARTAQTHNRVKKYQIPADATFLLPLGISTSEGRVKDKQQKKYRQINKFAEIILPYLNKMTSTESHKVMVDFGCGKGHLSFALDHLLNLEANKPWLIKGVDLKKTIIEEANRVAQNLKRHKNLSFEIGDIANYSNTQIDVMIALHACDTLTDIAIEKAISANAKLMVLAPCCHKQVRKDLGDKKHPLFKYGIYEERLSSILTDQIRGLLLEEAGYKVKIFEFISSEHTAKNIMLLAEYTGKKKDIKKELNDLKSNFGIQKHYLEHLLA